MLANGLRRTRALGGTLDIGPAPDDHGSILDWQVPIPAEAQTVGYFDLKQSFVDIPGGGERPRPHFVDLRFRSGCTAPSKNFQHTTLGRGKTPVPSRQATAEIESGDGV